MRSERGRRIYQNSTYALLLTLSLDLGPCAFALHGPSCRSHHPGSLLKLNQIAQGGSIILFRLITVVLVALDHSGVVYQSSTPKLTHFPTYQHIRTHTYIFGLGPTPEFPPLGFSCRDLILLILLMFTDLERVDLF